MVVRVSDQNPDWNALPCKLSIRLSFTALLRRSRSMFSVVNEVVVRMKSLCSHRNQPDT